MSNVELEHPYDVGIYVNGGSPSLVMTDSRIVDSTYGIYGVPVATLENVEIELTGIQAVYLTGTMPSTIRNSIFEGGGRLVCRPSRPRWRQRADGLW